MGCNRGRRSEKTRRMFHYLTKQPTTNYKSTIQTAIPKMSQVCICSPSVSVSEYIIYVLDMLKYRIDAQCLFLVYNIIYIYIYIYVYTYNILLWT